MQKKNFRHLTALATLFFGLNTLIPLSAMAQSTSIIGQIVDATGGALTLPCSLGDFALGDVDIDVPQALFTTYYMNPKTPDTDLTTCGGTGVTVQDTRYDGGFMLQVAASEYLKDGVGPELIAVDNLAVVTEQVSDSYLEDSSGLNAFTGGGDTLLIGSDADNEVDENVEVTQTLPFDFTYYGTTYPSGSTVYLCTNGTLAFQTGECDAPFTPPEAIFEDDNGGTGAVPRIIPYSKDLTTDSGIDASYGIFYANPISTQARFRWKGAPCVPDDTVPANCEETLTGIGTVEFELALNDNGDEDTIAFSYAATLDDQLEGPIVGVTRGGPAGIPVSSTYTESIYSEQMAGSDVSGGQADFLPSGADFTEVVKPGTEPVMVSANGDPTNDLDYVNFVEDAGNPGNSLNLDLINANADIGCGRVGIYTVYPSYKLDVPQATVEGDYTNTITYTLSDSTGPGTGSC